MLSVGGGGGHSFHIKNDPKNTARIFLESLDNVEWLEPRCIHHQHRGTYAHNRRTVPLLVVFGTTYMRLDYFLLHLQGGTSSITTWAAAMFTWLTRTRPCTESGIPELPKQFSTVAMRREFASLLTNLQQQRAVERMEWKKKKKKSCEITLANQSKQHPVNCNSPLTPASYLIIIKFVVCFLGHKATMQRTLALFRLPRNSSFFFRGDHNTLPDKMESNTKFSRFYFIIVLWFRESFDCVGCQFIQRCSRGEAMDGWEDDTAATTTTSEAEHLPINHVFAAIRHGLGQENNMILCSCCSNITLSLF